MRQSISHRKGNRDEQESRDHTSKDKYIDKVYEPPLRIGRGIWSESVEKRG